MGALCSKSVDKDGDRDAALDTESKAQKQIKPPRFQRRLHKMPAAVKPKKSITPSGDALQDLSGQNKFENEADYALTRENFIKAEKAIAFDAQVQSHATQLEKDAARVLKRVKDADWDKFYGTKFDVKTGKPTGKRDEGEHFLGMVDIINQTELFKIAKKMPKGAHLHIHFNSCLDAKFLIKEARNVDTMYIRSTAPLVAEVDDPIGSWRKLVQVTEKQLNDSIISFMVLTEEQAKEQNGKVRYGSDSKLSDEFGDLFTRGYRGLSWMPYKRFQERWNQQDPSTLPGKRGGIEALEDWLATKSIITEEQAHHAQQTSKGIWNEFNYRTQFMKGLFVYDTAYRNYTRACIKSFVEDNIQYAEIRPNFMKSNSVKYADHPLDSMDNFQTMEMIQHELKNTMDELTSQNKYFGGMKVIYCTPRVFANPLVKGALDECIEMKKRYPKLLCGFDLVGEEQAGNELRRFTKEFLEFQKDCADQRLEIPFLFHCGETLESGGKSDGNLYDAILLNAKRVGHGYALARHPLIMDIFKKKGMAIEACPISNEVLGLTDSAAGHHLNQFLANDVPCTLNADNGTLYRSTLSHDFYQAMVGSENMSLLGWKQLALWSLEHSCMEPDLKAEVTEVWEKAWTEFCQWIVDTYDTEAYSPTVDTSIRRPGHEWTKS